MSGLEIAGYRIVEELSPATDSGNASLDSQTYKALTPDGETYVIIKQFPLEVSRNRQILSQLHESMRTIYSMKHPNIPKIIGSGIDGGRPYIVTPYVAAGNLQDRIDRGILTALDVESLIVEIASALEYAHSHRILHGNLKPSNILVDEEGHVQVFDLGQASALGRLRSPSTPPYGGEEFKAPEVIQGVGMTPLSDQYSLGLIALVLLSGLPVAEGLLALNARLRSGSDSPKHARQLLGDLSQEIIEVLSRAISINPEKRFSSMAELKHALMTAFEHEGIQEIAPQSSPKKVHAPRQRKRRPKVALVGIIAIFLCFGVTLPVLSSVWKGSNGGSYTEMRLTPNANETLGSILTSQADSEITATNEGTPQHNPETSEPPAETTPDLPSMPTATQRTSSGNQPEPTATLQPTDTETISPTETPQTTNTETITPTASQAPTDTQLPSTTPTQEPTPTPPSIPTIDPSKCNDKPGHPRYCTPTP